MRHDPDAVMLFAAGFGTRMRPLTDHTPKPLIKVAGRALLDHALALAEGAAIPRKLVNAHYLAAQIETHLAGRDVAISMEHPEILDTGGGLRHALPAMGDPSAVYTLNTDAVWTGPNPLAALAAAWDPAQMDALMMLVPLEQAHGHKGQGDFVMDGSDACAPLRRGPGAVYSGAQIMKTQLLDGAPEGAFSLNLCWAKAEASGRLWGIAHPGLWCDVGHPGGIAEAEALLASAAAG
ncbi:MAG: nucleotidyltransferase family protein [Mangrovicoccus sp.]|nr:nucleotidyltransferase family protein [Mangrovicoccus sp.]